MFSASIFCIIFMLHNMFLQHSKNLIGLFQVFTTPSNQIEILYGSIEVIKWRPFSPIESSIWLLTDYLVSYKRSYSKPVQHHLWNKITSSFVWPIVLLESGPVCSLFWPKNYINRLACKVPTIVWSVKLHAVKCLILCLPGLVCSPGCVWPSERGGPETCDSGKPWSLLFSFPPAFSPYSWSANRMHANKHL